MTTTVYTYNNKVLKNVATDKWLKKPDIDPYNPLGLPAKTFRFQLRDGQSWAGAMTPTVVSEGIIDVTFTGSDFQQWLKTCISKVLGGNTTDFTSLSHLFQGCTYITEFPLIDTSNVTDCSYLFDSCSNLTSVPLLNTSSVTDMTNMFKSCSSLTSVPLLNTSSVTNMNNMFVSCSSLTAIPLFDTSNVTNMDYTFGGCYNVESGALALYQQASSQATPPSSHSSTFADCGKDTVTGLAELEQIPTSWGGRFII